MATPVSRFVGTATGDASCLGGRWSVVRSREKGSRDAVLSAVPRVPAKRSTLETCGVLPGEQEYELERARQPDLRPRGGTPRIRDSRPGPFARSAVFTNRAHIRPTLLIGGL
jgi:hypothetical protein